MWRKMLNFTSPKIANDCTDIDVVLRQINQRLCKLEKSDSEKTEEIGRYISITASPLFYK